ncbi:MAG: hypothetical protein IJS60_02690 [Abditibacteriota bacterium]|nr:hypothetical protein [Abditibacteriota bacterium]
MKKVYILLFIIFILPVASHAAYRNYTMYLYTYPNSIIADGNSSCDITAEVYDDHGNRVDDGIRVDFATTLGMIIPFDETSGGVATATLRSTPSVGTAIVTATIPAYGVAARTTIDFLEPGTEIVKDTFLAIDSDVYLGYDSETRIIDTVGGFTAKFKGVEFEGYEAQIDSLNATVKMRANLGEYFSLKKQDKVVRFSELWFSLSTAKGYGYMFDEEAENPLSPLKLVSVRLSDLKCEEIEYAPSNVDFKISPIEDSSVYVTASLFILDPKKEIKAKYAKVFVAEKKIGEIPWLRINVRDPNGVFGTPVSIGTNGINLNIPIYYYLSKNGSGAIRVQRNQSDDGTFSTGNDMWRLDMENEYGTGTDSSGTFKVTTFNKQAGLRFNNTTKLENSATFRGSIDYPNHQNLYSTLEFTQNLDKFHYSFQGKTYNYKNNNNRYYLSGYVQTQAKPLFNIKDLNYALSTQVYIDTSFEERRSRLVNKTGVDLFTKTINIGSFSLNANASYYKKYQQNHDGDNFSYNINGNIFFGDYGNFGIHYSYYKERYDETYVNKYISTDFGLGNEYIRLSGNGTYNFSDKNYSLYGELGIYPWRTWSLRFFNTYQHYYNEDQYLDYKVALGKQIGFTEIRLVWNKSRHRIDLEIGNVTF